MSIPAAVMSAVELDEFLAAAFPASRPTLGVATVTDRGVLMKLPVEPHHERPGGTMSGPAIMSLADAAAWLATVSRIGPVALSVTSSLNIHFLRKPPLADLWADAGLLRLGRRQSVSDVVLYSDVDGRPGDDPVAQATVVYAIPSAADGGGPPV